MQQAPEVMLNSMGISAKKNVRISNELVTVSSVLRHQEVARPKPKIADSCTAFKGLKLRVDFSTHRSALQATRFNLVGSPRDSDSLMLLFVRSEKEPGGRWVEKEFDSLLLKRQRLLSPQQVVWLRGQFLYWEPQPAYNKEALVGTVILRSPGLKARRVFARRRSPDRFLVAGLEKDALCRWESLGGSFLNARGRTASEALNNTALRLTVGPTTEAKTKATKLLHASEKERKGNVLAAKEAACVKDERKGRRGCIHVPAYRIG
eukprot:1161982-Pelagomonas_calceolata.AAC.1